jgi:tetratricopeptide (TPR) repeat protein
VLSLDPESAAAHHNLGVTYYQLEDLSSALDEFETALELDPDDPDTHYQLGATYLTLALSSSDPSATVDPELLEQATGEFEAALALRENMPEALIGLGNIYLQQGDYDAAIETLSQVIEVVPDSREAYYALGGAYAQSGNIDKACETYDEFISLEPPAAWRTQAEQVMTSLGCE